MGRNVMRLFIIEVEVDEFGNLVEKKNEDDGLEEDDEEEKKEKKVPQKGMTFRLITILNAVMCLYKIVSIRVTL